VTGGISVHAARGQGPDLDAIYRACRGRKSALCRGSRTRRCGLWEKHGIRQPDFWTTLIGTGSQEITYMLAWDSLAEREKALGAFLADSDMARWSQKRRRMVKLVDSISNQLLPPTVFSAVK